MSKKNYSILIHYSEIALKLNNRPYFERIFIKNIKTHIADLKYSKIKLLQARVFIHDVKPRDWDCYKSKLSKVMGMQNATLMIEVNTNLDLIKDAAAQIIDKIEFKNFRITAKRQFKQFKYNSNDISVIVGEHVQNISNKPVNLNFPDMNIIIEILKDKTYVGVDKIVGFSGMPARCQEQALCLLSSGIDSPVASFEMIKRGIKLDFIHFHSYPAINKQSINNVKKIMEVLLQYQLKSILYLVPILDIQQKIMEIIPDKFWVIFFRRAMLKIANLFASKNKQVAIITGDSVGQVASQTLSNIRATSEISTLPVLRPLSGMNKNEIINKAKKIGTYDISIKPYQDCCSYFVPIHPETKANLNEVLNLDTKLDLEHEYNEALNNIDKFSIKFLGD